MTDGSIQTIPDYLQDNYHYFYDFRWQVCMLGCDLCAACSGQAASKATWNSYSAEQCACTVRGLQSSVLVWA